MIKDNQSGLNRLHVVLDALVTVVSYLLAWYIVIGSGWARQLGKQTLEMRNLPGRAHCDRPRLSAFIFIL